MTGLRWLQMPEPELNDFLDNGGTGVISFATGEGEPPYSLPVSYGYDADSSHFHFRLGITPNSDKGKFLDRPVSFVTHDETDEGWCSVVATGELEDLTDEPYDSPAIQERWNVSIPLVDIFEVPPKDVTFHQFRLDPDKLTGRKDVNSGG